VVNVSDSDKHYHEGRTTMHPGDQSTSDDPAYDTPALQTTLFPLPVSHPLPIREFLTTDQPRNRLAHQGASALSDAELLAVITGVPCLETA
jgi:DNA repair protein RadC